MSQLPLEQLASPVAVVRQGAAEALTSTPLAEALGALLDLLRGDPAPAVRGAAATALGGYPPTQTHGALIEAACRDSDHTVRVAAVSAVLRAGPDSARSLVQIATHSETGPARGAADAAVLGLGRYAGLALLNPALSDPDKLVRIRAARLLARLGGEKAVRELALLLADPESQVAAEAHRQLAQMIRGSCEHASAVVALLGQPLPEALQVAVLCLIDTHRCPGVLTALVDSRGALVGSKARQAASLLLASLVRAPRFGLTEGQQEIEPLRVGEWPEAAELLRSFLEDSDAFTRSTALRAAGELGSRDFLGTVVRALDDEDLRCRTAAAGAAARIGDAASVERVLDLAEADSARFPPFALADVLSHARSPRAFGVLRRLLAEPVGPWDTGSLVEALLHQADPRSPGVLLEALDAAVDRAESQIEGRFAALLAKLPEVPPVVLQVVEAKSPEEERELLKGLMRTHAALTAREGALRECGVFDLVGGLAQVGRAEAIPSLARLIPLVVTSARTDIARDAVDSIARRGGESAVEPMAEALLTGVAPPARWLLGVHLSRLGDARGVGPLLEFARHALTQRVWDSRYSDLPEILAAQLSRHARQLDDAFLQEAVRLPDKRFTSVMCGDIIQAAEPGGIWGEKCELVWTHARELAALERARRR